MRRRVRRGDRTNQPFAIGAPQRALHRRRAQQRVSRRRRQLHPARSRSSDLPRGGLDLDRSRLDSRTPRRANARLAGQLEHAPSTANSMLRAEFEFHCLAGIRAYPGASHPRSLWVPGGARQRDRKRVYRSPTTTQQSRPESQSFRTGDRRISGPYPCARALSCSVVALCSVLFGAQRLSSTIHAAVRSTRTRASLGRTR
jgi:hypothetical protein